MRPSGTAPFADATVSDVLHFAGLSSGTISFTYQLDGSSTQSLDGQLGYGYYDLLVGSQAFGKQKIGRTVDPPSSVTLEAAFSGGVLLLYTLQLEAAVRTDNVIGTLDETVDFLHTATLTGVQVFDSSRESRKRPDHSGLWIRLSVDADIRRTRANRHTFSGFVFDWYRIPNQTQVYRSGSVQHAVGKQQRNLAQDFKLRIAEDSAGLSLAVNANEERRSGHSGGIQDARSSSP